MHRACQYENLEAVIALLRRHSNLNVRANDHTTPLDCANDPEIRKRLRSAGAKTGKELDAQSSAPKR